MQKKETLDQDRDIFSATRMEDIIIIRFNETFLLRVTDLETKAAVLDYLDLVSKNDTIGAVVIFGSPEERTPEEYIEFYRQILEWDLSEIAFARIYNAVDQFILSITGLNKIVIHVDRRKAISLFLNMSLACDYRIVMDDAIFQNVPLELGLVPKGGGPFFLSKMLGLSKAGEILLSPGSITASEALRLGMVNQIVPSGENEDIALKTALDFAQRSPHSLYGIKKLLNYSIKDLGEYLELENKGLFRIVNYTDFRNRLAKFTKGPF